MTLIIQTENGRYTLWNVTNFTVDSTVTQEKEVIKVYHSDRPVTFINEKLLRIILVK